MIWTLVSPKIFRNLHAAELIGLMRSQSKGQWDKIEEGEDLGEGRSQLFE